MEGLVSIVVRLLLIHTTNSYFRSCFIKGEWGKKVYPLPSGVPFSVIHFLFPLQYLRASLNRLMFVLKLFLSSGQVGTPSDQSVHVLRNTLQTTSIVPHLD